MRIVSLFFAGVGMLFASGFLGEGFAANKQLRQSFAPGDDLAAIRTKIVANGYDFKVSSNWVVELPQKIRDRMRSRHKSSFMVRHMAEKVLSDPLKPLLSQPLPQKFDLRSVGSPGRSFIGSVRQQGSCGACYAFGACAAAEAAYNLATGSCDQDCIDFSEAFIAFCLDPLYDGFDGCWGSDYDYEELDALVNNGVCSEKLLPYDPTINICPKGFDPPTVRFTSWYRLPCNDTHAIKSAIYHFGAVDVAVATNPAFDAYASGIYEDTKTDCFDPENGICYFAPTDHVVALVGWDDNGGNGYWILRNSWGREWGEAGYMRIKYQSANVACAACYLVYTPKESLLPPPSGPKRVVTPWLRLLLDD